MTITNDQNKILHTLLSATRQMHLKAELVGGFTGGRTTSSRELHQYEAMELIKHLQAQANKTHEPLVMVANKMRRKIIAMAREIKWEIKKKANMARINNWCKQYGYLHKPLNDYTYKELPQLITQFEKGPYLSFHKK